MTFDPRWLDDRELDLHWDPPVTALRFTTRWRVALALLVVVALVAAVVLSGAFKTRTDLTIRYEPGAVIDATGYQVKLHRAVVQEKQNLEGESVFLVTVHGEIRSQADEPIRPVSGDTLITWFPAQDPASGVVQELKEIKIGNNLFTGTLQPGGGWQQLLLQYEFNGEEYRPTSRINTAVRDLEFTDNSLLQDGRRVWNLADESYMVNVPVVWGPDAER